MIQGRAIGNASRPLKPGNAGQVSEDGRAALVEFDIRGDTDDAVLRITIEDDKPVVGENPAVLVDDDALDDEVRPLEAHFVEQLLHHGMKSARADVLRPLVDDGGKVAVAAQSEILALSDKTFLMLARDSNNGQGLKGDAIPLGARILAICDAYEAPFAISHDVLKQVVIDGFGAPYRDIPKEDAAALAQQ